ncbi:MAG: helix-turn-helix transcriptional regulator [Leucobacter sp.]|nr:helix-turn-helix transcriptional regulator [Leucobacter sp.]
MAIKTNGDVAAKVRGTLAERRLKQADVASEVKLSRMAVHRRLSGETPFTPQELIAVAELCDVPVSTFFGEVAA